MTADRQPNSNEREPQSSPLRNPKERLSGFQRYLRYRLVIPIARGRKDSRVTARGTAVGLGMGLTPTVGVQMFGILLFWGFMKWYRPDWRFNLVVALAWTWPTNILTAPFAYYAFLVTGKLMLGESPFIHFDVFREEVSSLLTQDAGFWESLSIYTIEIAKRWGVPMFIGSIPWAILGGWLGYRMTLSFLERYRKRQRDVMLRRRKRWAARRLAKGKEGLDHI